LNRAGKGAALIRGVYFSSAVLSVTIVTLIWRFVLAPDAGLLGELWKALGWQPLPFLSDSHLVLPALALTTIWSSLGLPVPLFLIILAVTLTQYWATGRASAADNGR